MLDPSVQSGSTGYGQTSNVYTPHGQYNNQFNGNAANTNTYGQQQQQQQPQTNFQSPMVPAPISTQPPTNQFVPFTPNVIPGYGVPPIEMAQDAGNLPPPPTQLLKNPTPPPGWNDPPALKSSRKPVSASFTLVSL